MDAAQDDSKESLKVNKESCEFLLRKFNKLSVHIIRHPRLATWYMVSTDIVYDPHRTCQLYTTNLFEKARVDVSCKSWPSKEVDSRLET